MSNVIQLTFFDTFEEQILSENRFLKEEMKKVTEKSMKTHTSSDKVRKALFARHGEMQKRIDDLEERLKRMERGLCYDNKPCLQ